MSEVYERIYHHQLTARSETPIEVEIGKSVRKVFASTGRLRMTLYAAGRSRAWASFGVEKQAHLYVKDGETMRILGPFVEEDHLGIQWRAADYTEKITLHEADLLHHAVWLAHGELSGDAAVEALWSLLWSALTDSKEFRDSLAQYWPKWVQGLGLEAEPPPEEEEETPGLELPSGPLQLRLVKE